LKHLKLIENSREGFTLIELLITVFFVSVGLIGVIVFFNASLESQFDAKNEIIAAGLAQEGAELVRNKAEYHKLGGFDWSAIKNALVTCKRIDYKSLSGAHDCYNSTVSEYICFSDGRYQQCDDSGDGIGMQRYLDIICVDINGTIDACANASAVGLKVAATVEWNDDSRVTTATDIIYENEY
jgi:Tfp pilus assembly protein PilV